MLKRHILIDPAHPSASKQSKSYYPPNWELCALCQEETGEVLQCPARSTSKPSGIGYTSLARDLLAFQEYGQIPPELDLDRLDDGDGIEDTLRTNRAQWHKACRVKYNETKLQRRRKSDEKAEQSDTITVHTRSTHTQASQVNTKDPLCFFCNKPAGSEILHEASTKQFDLNVRKAALETKDTELLVKLAPGDMIALEAKYHRNCLRMLYNKARQAAPKDEQEKEAQLHGIAFAELVAFMEEKRGDDCVPVFKLADLGDLYQRRLEQLNATVGNRIHTTRLKNRLLSEFPDLMAHSQGKDILLTFQDDIGDALKKACDHDSDAMHLVRAAQVVRREMFATKLNFDGSFQPNCQKESVPTSLLALVNMILDGASIQHQTQLLETGTTAALTVSQLLVFNSVKHTRAVKSSGTVRHSRDKETPLPMYIALKIHAVTRCRTLIDTLFSLGMCVSYDRVLQVSADIANGVCQRFRLDNIVCPPKMRTGLFTTAAVDNIDHNPSSGTSQGSFHGTGISLIQHPTLECVGSDRGIPVINQSYPSTRSIMPLPQAYTHVPPVALIRKPFTAPPVNGPVRPLDLKMTAKTRTEEHEWLRAVMVSLDNLETNKGNFVSWSAYHADIQQTVIPPAAIHALMPLFVDNAHSAAMIRHSMDVVRAAVHHLNPGQVTVLAADQPLFALAKEIQWTWPESHGENHFVIMFGGLHIEMAVLKVGPIFSVHGKDNVTVVR